MSPTKLNALAVIAVVCAVATGGIAASAGGAIDIAVDDDEHQAMTDGTAADPPTANLLLTGKRDNKPTNPSRSSLARR